MMSELAVQAGAGFVSVKSSRSEEHLSNVGSKYNGWIKASVWDNITKSSFAHDCIWMHRQRPAACRQDVPSTLSKSVFNK